MMGFSTDNLERVFSKPENDYEGFKKMMYDYTHGREIYDEDGNPVYTVTVTCNGVPVDYAAFEAAYNNLSLVTVSGTLPAAEAITAQPHTVYTFTDVDGTVHTVALATFDVLHDAVIVDGHAAFYLIKGGFKLNME